MTCEQVTFELKAYVDGELGWLTNRRMARHLAACESCRAERDALAAVSAKLRGGESFELPETLRARLVALAPEPVATIPRRRMPTLAWGAVGGACLATLAAVYVKPDFSPTTARDASPSLSNAPAAELAPKSEAKVATTAREYPAAPSVAKPAPAFAADAPRSVDLQETATSSFEEIPAKKSGGRGRLSTRTEFEFATVSVAASLSDDALIAAVGAVGGNVVSKKPLLLEIAPESLSAFRKRVGDRSPEPERANRTSRIVKVRLRSSPQVRP